MRFAWVGRRSTNQPAACSYTKNTFNTLSGSVHSYSPLRLHPMISHVVDSKQPLFQFCFLIFCFLIWKMIL